MNGELFLVWPNEGPGPTPGAFCDVLVQFR